jgi:hypothetical protein
MDILAETLRGSVVTSTEALHDYVQIGFDGKAGLTINNKMNILPASTPLPSLIGKVVAWTNQTDSFVEIRFRDGTLIRIDMRPEAWSCPEAIILNRNGLPTVVWN